MAKTDFDPFFLLDTFGLEILRLERRMLGEKIHISKKLKELSVLM